MPQAEAPDTVIAMKLKNTFVAEYFEQVDTSMALVVGDLSPFGEPQQVSPRVRSASPDTATYSDNGTRTDDRELSIWDQMGMAVDSWEQLDQSDSADDSPARTFTFCCNLFI